MAKFLFTYRMPANFDGTDAADMSAWGTYFQKLGSHVDVLGNPTGETTSVGSVGDGSTLGGYSIIEADSLAEAADLAAAAPTVSSGGGIEIGELLDVPEM
jgi:hypothetical protein